MKGVADYRVLRCRVPSGRQGYKRDGDNRGGPRETNSLYKAFVYRSSTWVSEHPSPNPVVALSEPCRAEVSFERLVKIPRPRASPSGPV